MQTQEQALRDVAVAVAGAPSTPQATAAVGVREPSVAAGTDGRASSAPMQRLQRDSASRTLLAHLVGLIQALTGELELDRVYEAVLRVVQEVTGAERVTLQLVDETQQALVLVAGLGLPPGAQTGQSSPRAQGVAGWVLAHGRPLLVVGTTHPDAEVQRLLRAVPGQSALCVPLSAKGQQLGVLNASKFDPVQPFDEADLDLLAVLAGQAAIALAHARLYDQMARLATTDGLTGLLNHRTFQERLGAELDRAARTRTELALLTLDLDQFKLVNDTAGHAAGDRLLHLVAQEAILASVRVYDVAARTGGDEFAVILPHTSVENAQVVGERIRRAVLELDYAAHGLPAAAVSASIGVAHFPSDGLRREDLLEVVDKGLYYAKYQGKNQLQRGSAGVITFERDPAKLQQLLEGANHAVMGALAAAVDARDPYTAGHSQRVADMVVRLARELGHDDLFIQRLRLAALFHDVGKIGVPDAILRKPGRLEDDEYRQMQQHPVIGADQLLRHVPFLRDQLPAIRHHHERWDGRGYPDGLAGEAIPYQARLLAIADAYDAMTSNRVYRQALLQDDVLRIFATGAGIQWDSDLTAAWLRYVEQQPQVEPVEPASGARASQVSAA